MTGERALSSAPLWLPHTATIDWCEPNYTHTPRVVEWWNTWSNLAYVAFGCHQLLARIPHNTRGTQLLALLLCAIGLSSGAFHGTLKLSAQLADEIAMNLFISLLNFMLYPIISPCIATLVFTAAHVYRPFTTAFQAQFLLQVAWTFRLLGKHRMPLRDLVGHFAPMAIGFSCWCSDYLACTSLGYWGGHGWWHILTAFEGWQMIVFVRELHDRERRLQSLGKSTSAILLPFD